MTYLDLKYVEQAAREKLKCGLDVREALSPYKGNVAFETYVKQFDYEAGWGNPAPELDRPPCLGNTASLIDVIDAADQSLHDARDLYAYLAVFAPEHRFRADDVYISDTPAGYDAPLCSATDKEGPGSGRPGALGSGAGPGDRLVQLSCAAAPERARGGQPALDLWPAVHGGWDGSAL